MSAIDHDSVRAHRSGNSAHYTGRGSSGEEPASVRHDSAPPHPLGRGESFQEFIYFSIAFIG
jgi:hypothetical protein